MLFQDYSTGKKIVLSSCRTRLDLTLLMNKVDIWDKQYTRFGTLFFFLGGTKGTQIILWPSLLQCKNKNACIQTSMQQMVHCTSVKHAKDSTLYCRAAYF